MASPAAAVSSHDWEGSKDDLEELMRKYAPQLLQLSYEEAATGFPEISFELTNPRVKDVINRLAKKVRDVSDTTREQIRGWIDAGTEEGLSPQQIAKQIRTNAENIGPSRALMIARTESAAAYNGGAILAYRDAGVEKVEVLDGDEDEECAAANGQIWTLEEAEANPTAHPNCTRAFSPVVE